MQTPSWLQEHTSANYQQVKKKKNTCSVRQTPSRLKVNTHITQETAKLCMEFMELKSKAKRAHKKKMSKGIYTILTSLVKKTECSRTFPQSVTDLDYQVPVGSTWSSTTRVLY